MRVSPGRLLRLAYFVKRKTIGAEVESSNTVGYMKLSTVEGLNLIGVQLQTVGGNGSNLSATMAISGLVGYDWDAFSGGDEMLVWDKEAQGYSTSYVYAGDSVPAAITEALGYDLSGKWMDGDMLPVSEPIPVGGAVWIDSKTESNSASVRFSY